MGSAKARKNVWSFAQGATTGGVSLLWDQNAQKALLGTPGQGTPDAMVSVPDLSEDAIRAAKLMERRRQLSMQGQASTWLTGARGDSSQVTIGSPALLGG